MSKGSTGSKVSKESKKLCSEIGAESIGVQVIGHETCIYKCLSNISKGAGMGREVRLVTPVVPERYNDELLDLVKSFCTKWCCSNPITLVVNDMGFLNLVYKSYNKEEWPTISFAAGRVLTHSLLDCPWYEKIIAADEDVKGAYENYSSLAQTLPFFKRFNVDELELNCHKAGQLDLLKGQGFKIVAYEFYNLMSVSRTCFEQKLKAQGRKDPLFSLANCIEEPSCVSKSRIRLKKQYNQSMLVASDQIEVNSPFFEDLYFEGNAVYRKLGQEEQAVLGQFDILIKECV